MLSFSVNFPLTVKCPPVRAWVEVTRPDLGILGPVGENALRALAKDERYAPWVTWDDSQGAGYVKYLVWEPAGPPRNVGPEAMLGLLPLCQAWAATDHEAFESALLDFYARYGPLFGQERRRIPLLVAANEVNMLLFLAFVLRCTKGPPKKGFPLPVGSLERVMELGAEMFPEAGEFSPDPFSLVKPTTLTSSWMRWPRKPASFKSRDEAIEWAKDKVVVPSLERLLREKAGVRIRVGAGWKLAGSVVLPDIYTMAALAMVVGPPATKTCASCGKPLPPGRKKWCSRACGRRSHAKQNVLSRFRTWKNRGKISPAEYEQVKAYLNKLKRHGITDEDEMARLAFDWLRASREGSRQR